MTVPDNPGCPQNVTATWHVLIQDVLPILHGLKRGNRTETTDEKDLQFARILARGLWQSGWRKRGTA